MTSQERVASQETPGMWPASHFENLCWENCQPRYQGWTIPLLPFLVPSVFHLRSPLGQYKLTFDKPERPVLRKLQPWQPTTSSPMPRRWVAVCRCHAGRVFWVSRWGCCFLLTQELWLFAFLEGEFRSSQACPLGVCHVSAQSGCFTDIIVQSYNILEVDVPTAILQIGKLRFGRCTCPTSPNQEVADPGLNILKVVVESDAGILGPQAEEFNPGPETRAWSLRAFV